MNEFGCEMCKYKCTKKSNLDIHLSTKKHLEMETLLKANNGTLPANTNTRKKFHCEPCGFICYKNACYIRHTQTQKHMDNTQKYVSSTPSELTAVSAELMVQLLHQSKLITQLLEERLKTNSMPNH